MFSFIEMLGNFIILTSILAILVSSFAEEFSLASLGRLKLANENCNPTGYYTTTVYNPSSNTGVTDCTNYVDPVYFSAVAEGCCLNTENPFYRSVILGSSGTTVTTTTYFDPDCGGVDGTYPNTLTCSQYTTYATAKTYTVPSSLSSASNKYISAMYAYPQQCTIQAPVAFYQIGLTNTCVPQTGGAYEITCNSKFLFSTYANFNPI